MPASTRQRSAAPAASKTQNKTKPKTSRKRKVVRVSVAQPEEDCQDLVEEKAALNEVGEAMDDDEMEDYNASLLEVDPGDIPELDDDDDEEGNLVIDADDLDDIIGRTAADDGKSGKNKQKEKEKDKLVVKENDIQVTLPSCKQCNRFFSAEKHLKRHMNAVHNNKGAEIEISQSQSSIIIAEEKIATRKEIQINISPVKELPDLKRIQIKDEDEKEIAVEVKEENVEADSSLEVAGDEDIEDDEEEEDEDIIDDEGEEKSGDAQGASISAIFRKCPDCPQKFSSKISLNLHRLKAHMILLKQLPCPVCKEEHSDLTVHMRTAHKVDGIVCPHCANVFSKKCTLNRHIEQVHLNIQIHKPATCNLCGKVFSKKGHLDRHVKIIHKGIKDYSDPCPYCGKVFTTRASLEPHIAMVHQGVRKKCTICNKVLSDLNKHMRTVHNTYRRRAKIPKEMISELDNPDMKVSPQIYGSKGFKTTPIPIISSTMTTVTMTSATESALTITTSPTSVSTPPAHLPALIPAVAAAPAADSLVNGGPSPKRKKSAANLPVHVSVEPATGGPAVANPGLPIVAKTVLPNISQAGLPIIAQAAALPIITRAGLPIISPPGLPTITQVMSLNPNLLSPVKLVPASVPTSIPALVPAAALQSPRKPVPSSEAYKASKQSIEAIKQELGLGGGITLQKIVRSTAAPSTPSKSSSGTVVSPASGGKRGPAASSAAAKPPPKLTYHGPPVLTATPGQGVLSPTSSQPTHLTFGSITLTPLISQASLTTTAQQPSPVKTHKQLPALVTPVAAASAAAGAALIQPSVSLAPGVNGIPTVFGGMDPAGGGLTAFLPPLINMNGGLGGALGSIILQIAQPTPGAGGTGIIGGIPAANMAQLATLGGIENLASTPPPLKSLRRD